MMDLLECIGIGLAGGTAGVILACTGGIIGICLCVGGEILVETLVDWWTTYKGQTTPTRRRAGHDMEG